MFHRLTFSPLDLVSLRFAYSPLKEVVASVKAVARPERRVLHHPWLRRVRPRLDGLDLAPLGDLVVQCSGYIPDFLTPPPATPGADITLELATLRATPASVIRNDLAGLDTPFAAELRADPAAGIERLVAAIEAYWEAAFAPYWPAMRNLLDGDVLYRVRVLHEGGAARLFEDLHPGITWEHDTLTVKRSSGMQTRVLAGDGLLLIPSVFVWPNTFSRTNSPGQPTVTYPARGLATLWERDVPPDPGALAAVIGAPRARILAELNTPLSTTELGRRLGLPLASVSEHLAKLREARLVASFRTGRSVLYARTKVGDALLVGKFPEMGIDAT
ncbi:ArsR/SmtB family transcription factor [Herbidospora sp. RD11066]